MATATAAPGELRTEADVVKTLRAGTYTLQELYALVEDCVDVARDGGLDAINDSTDTRWRRRVRGALQQLRARGDGHRVARSCWAIDGTPDQPRRMILIHGGGSVADFELRVQDAVRTLRELTEPADVVVTDPPWGLRRDHGPEAERLASLYGNRCVVPGYVDVDPAGYEEFTHRWVAEAAGALRPGGQLVVVTGPQQAAVVQIAAQHAGLTFVSSIAARRDFPLYTTRRPSFAHWTVTTMVRGSLRHPRRVWNTPPDLPKAASGADYPLDVWEHNGRDARGRAGLLIYDNTLPSRFAWRLIYGFSNPGELVVCERSRFCQRIASSAGSDRSRIGSECSRDVSDAHGVTRGLLTDSSSGAGPRGRRFGLHATAQPSMQDPRVRPGRTGCHSPSRASPMVTVGTPQWPGSGVHPGRGPRVHARLTRRWQRIGRMRRSIPERRWRRALEPQCWTGSS
ncbi:MAG TPA: DNA methyltransferase [Solirubrobacteraceae bacterium]|jgi:hypothetical protein|nr:DNA methyltransferase [Solirubrobacteraceae bacterium]